MLYGACYRNSETVANTTGCNFVLSIFFLSSVMNKPDKKRCRGTPTVNVSIVYLSGGRWWWVARGKEVC